MVVAYFSSIFNLSSLYLAYNESALRFSKSWPLIYDILRAFKANIVAFVGNRCSLDDITQIKVEVNNINNIN